MSHICFRQFCRWCQHDRVVTCGRYKKSKLSWCSVLQCVAMCCNVLQCVAVCCNVLQCVAVPVLGMPAHTCGRQHGFSANILHLGFVLNNSTARTCDVCCCVLQCVAVCCNGFSDSILHLRFVFSNSIARICGVAVWCGVLQCVPLCCSGFSDSILHLEFSEMTPRPVPVVLQRAVVCYNVLQCALVCCCVVQRGAACRSVLQYFRKLAKKIDLLRIYF